MADFDDGDEVEAGDDAGEDVDALVAAGGLAQIADVPGGEAEVVGLRAGDAGFSDALLQEIAREAARVRGRRRA